MLNESRAPSATKQKSLIIHVESCSALYWYTVMQYYCELNKLFRRIMVFITIFCLVLIHVFANGQEKQNVPLPISFRGAELYADIHEKGKLTVYLKKYYDCGSETVSETELISMQENLTMRIDPPVQLKKLSQEIQENKHLHFGDGNKGCVSVITYSAEVDLGEKRMDHIIIWGHCCFEPSITNLDPVNRQGFALTLRINNDGSLQKNAMPSLTELPAFIMKQNTEVSRVLGIHDKDQDKVVVLISTPFSLVGEMPEPGNSVVDYNTTGNSTVITPKAPFKKISYSQGFSDENPINSKLFSIQEHTGLFRYKPTKAGKYVAAVTIKDTRDGKILSEHQCVFLIDVLP